MKRYYFLLIFILALALRLTVAISSREIPSYDAAGYDQRAVSIVEEGAFGAGGNPTAFKEPFYSFFLAGIYYIFGHSYLIVRIIQAIIGVFTCGLIFLIGKNLFSDKVGILSGILASVNLSFIKGTEHLLTETLFTFIFILAICYALRLVKTLNFKDSIILGLCLGIGSLTRSVLAPFTILICAILFFLLRKRYALKKVLVNLFVIFACFLIPIIPWSVRNWSVFHEFIPISTNVGINLYSSYFPPQGKLFGFTADDENTRYARALNSEPAASKYLLRKACEGIRKLSPGCIFRLEMLKFMYFWAPFDWEIIGKGVYNFSYGFILPFFIRGFLMCIKKWRQYFLLYLPVLYFQAMALFFYGSPRFRMPLEPFIIVFAAAGIVCFFEKFSKKTVPLIMLTIFLLLNLAGYFYSSLLKDYTKCILLKIGLW